MLRPDQNTKESRKGQSMNLPDLLQLSGGYWSTCTLHAGVKLDIFTCLTDSAMTTPELARQLSADERGLGMLLHALTALELLHKEENTFRSTAFSATYLSKKSDSYMGHIIMHHHHLVEGWSRLDEAVLRGEPVRQRLSHEALERERESFLMGMFNLASLNAPRIASALELSGHRRMLDLAGGPGTYAIHFCLHNPDLTAVVYDLPTTRPFAEQTIRHFGLSERITFQAGDVLSDRFGTGYDLVWISHLLHSESPADSATVVAKAAESLADGGRLLIQEFILDNTKTAPLFPALFSLNMLLGTRAGQSYTQQELVTLMNAAGLCEVSKLSLDLPNGAGVMTGTACR